MTKNISVLIILCSLWYSSLSQTPKNIIFEESVLALPNHNRSFFDSSFHHKYIEKSNFQHQKRRLFLNMGYGNYNIKNQNEWKDLSSKHDIRIKKVTLIFTDYPNVKKSNYYKLLSKRIQSLINLDSRFNSNSIVWEFIIQTGNPLKSNAISKKHGFEIMYDVIDYQIAQKAIPRIKQIIKSDYGDIDSTVHNYFTETEIKNAMVVIDWTISMYKNGGQAVLWHLNNLQRSGIKYFVFFNDGDWKKQNEKTIGNTGGVYLVEAKNIKNLVSIMKRAKSNGGGGEDPENDIEAIIKGLKKWNDIEDIILIADNSPIRDISLVNNIDKKVDVILTGIGNYIGYVNGSYYGIIEPDYLKIIKYSNGTLVSKKENIIDISSMINDNILKLKTISYKFSEPGNFEPVLPENTK